jgi:DNA-binding FadR family transcriptional regulator
MANSPSATSEEAMLRLEAMIRDGTFPEGALLPSASS